MTRTSSTTPAKRDSSRELEAAGRLAVPHLAEFRRKVRSTAAAAGGTAGRVPHKVPPQEVFVSDKASALASGLTASDTLWSAFSADFQRSWITLSAVANTVAQARDLGEEIEAYRAFDAADGEGTEARKALFLKHARLRD
jgi:hypothetical protein